MSFRHELGALTQQRMLAKQGRLGYSNQQWIMDHLDDILKALEYGVCWSAIYDLAMEELPEPMSFPGFTTAVLRPVT